MTAVTATDILWAVLSPDAYNLLIDHRRWSREQFGAWATNALLATLVGGGVPKARRRAR